MSANKISKRHREVSVKQDVINLLWFNYITKQYLGYKIFFFFFLHLYRHCKQQSNDWTPSWPIRLFILLTNLHRGKIISHWVLWPASVCLFGVFDMKIRFKNHSLIGLRQQMKAGQDSFEVFNNRQKPLCHMSCQAQCDSIG